MKLEHWHILLASRRDIRAAIDAVLPPESPSPASPVTKRVGGEAIAALREKLVNLILDLKAALGADLDEREVEQAAMPITLHVDEMVRRRLADVEQSLYRPLQLQLYGRHDDGGDYFYQYADEKLASPDTAPFAFEILHFCLTAGFVGRYAGNTALLRQYKERLAARIPKPPPAGAPVAPKQPEERPVQEFPVWYYVATGCLVVAVPFLLWVISR